MASYPQRQKTIVDDTKFKLSTDQLKGGKGRPTLSLYCANSPDPKFKKVSCNPRIDVYTNIPGAKDNGLIRAKFDVPTLFQMFYWMEKLATDANGTSYAIDCETPGQDGKPYVESTIAFGKDATGRIFITIIDKKDDSSPKVRFYFTNSFYHKLRRSGGEPLTEGDISIAAALGWVNMFKQFFPLVAVQQYKAGESGQRGEYAGNRVTATASSDSDSFEDDLNF